MKTGKVRFVYRHFAFLGPESTWAAQASECASEQGRFWDFHDTLFANQSGENKGAFAKERLKGFASELGLDLPSFNACLDSERTQPRLQEDMAAGQQMGVKATPTILVNNLLLQGAPPFEILQKYVEQELAK